MATKPIRSVTKNITPAGSNLVLLDDGVAMGKATLTDAVTAVAGPLADAKIEALNLDTASQKAVEFFATAAQGTAADTAVQPGDLATVATSGAYDDLTGKPTLGTAAATDAADYATAAQGATADSAVQPGDLGTAAMANTTDFATAAQGAVADTAVQPGDLGDLALKDKAAIGDIDATGTPSSTTFLSGDGTWSTPTGAGDMLKANNLDDVADAPTSLSNLGLSKFERQNGFIEKINQSKLTPGYRRASNVFADGFKATDGINSGSSSNYTADTILGRVVPSTSYGGVISGATGTNFGDMTVNGGLAAAFDGTTNKGVATAARTVLNVTTGYVGKNYSSAPKTIYRATAYATNDGGFDATTSAQTITLTLFGKQTAPASGTDGVVLGTTGTFADAASLVKSIISNDNVTKWNYVWAYVTGSQTNGAENVAQLIFEPTVFANMTIVGTAQTADASVSSGRVLIEYANDFAPTLNTDLTVEVTCNGGTNWSAATLSLVSSNGQNGHSIAETALTACTPGTSFSYRLKTLNNVCVPIYGVALEVK